MPRDTLAEEAWEGLARAQMTLMRLFREDFRHTEVSMREYDVLFTLSRCPRGTRMGELADHVLLTQPGISRLVDRMADDGLIERAGVPGDRRSTVVRLTDRGREVFWRVGREHAAAIQRRVGAVLTPDELRALRAITTKLSAAQAAVAASAPEAPAAG
ncbi:MarR family winged helix-turn-helix transcriptional regulator [Nocardiopsis trehalosi]|uniref:MarR family winged helix-turn-helix transcriptional regulator n=1 Tax=Nocardiopsis trehalosi TaxID=109329 RepID=UPI00082D6FA8|nr:MarR family transcriptional regulator [Nocardiopsis trehalosi]